MATILTYHHIAEPLGEKEGLYVSPSEFAEQMDFLRRKGFSVVSLDDIREHLLGRKSLTQPAVAITFDDGFSDVYENAFPVLKQNGFTSTVFLIVNRVKENKPGYLNLNQIKEMMRDGICFGSHTLTHPHLARLPDGEQTREIEDSKKELQEMLGISVDWFSYPYGNFNRTTIKKVEQAGYKGAVSAIRDNRVKQRELFYLPRVMVMPGISIKKFNYYFSYLYHLVHWWKNRRRWRI